MQALEQLRASVPTVAQLVDAAAAALAGAGISTARLDAEVLLALACNLDRTALYARRSAPVPPPAHAAFDAMLKRRLAREPLAYIAGHQEFWSLDFAVTPDVLIPRPETELVVELALATLSPEGRHVKLCDLGTGSGCIATALAHELPHAEIWAVDVSPAALGVAAANARRHGVTGRVHIVESNLIDALQVERFDVVVCNPPYVSSADLMDAQPELTWEPRRALDGGADGLQVIRQVLGAVPQCLVDGGTLIIEIGAEQGAAVAAMARAARLRDISVRSDYAGLPRVLLARR
jgi:release factor glutamine methyltransferase